MTLETTRRCENRSPHRCHQCTTPYAYTYSPISTLTLRVHLRYSWRGLDRTRVRTGRLICCCLRKDGKRMSHYDTHHSANARPSPPPPPRTNLEVWPEHSRKLPNKICEQLFAHSPLH